jgi:hypothetical protein
METEAYRKLSGFDFSDGHPIGIAWNGWTLLLDYMNWLQETLRLKFKGVAFLSGYGGGASLRSATVSWDSPEIEQAKKMLTHDWHTNEFWKTKNLTQLVIFGDVPLLTIILEDVEIERLSDPTNAVEAKFAEFRDTES